jgi:hypothetical protein
MSKTNPILDQGSPTSEARMAIVESYLNIILPPIYRQFLLKTNGGVPFRKRMRITSNRDGTDLLDYMLSIDDQRSYRNFLSANAPLVAYINHGIVSIGETAGACLVCFWMHSKIADRIYYIDISDEFLADGTKPLHYLAENVATFLDDLED